MQDKITAYRAELEQCFKETEPWLYKKLERIACLMLKPGRTIFILGNGGSASTATHMAVDLGKGVRVSGCVPLRVISLADSVGLITAWANDVAYQTVFQEQLESLMRHGDMVIGVSASGNSPNVLTAMAYAKANGAVTVGFIGFGGGALKHLVDIDVTVSSKNYGVVEDFHLSLNHMLSQGIKEFLERGARWNRPSW